MEERLIVLKNICDKSIMIMIKNTYIYSYCWNNMIFHSLYLFTYDIIF